MGRALAFILTPKQVGDTSMLAATVEQIRAPAGPGRPQNRRGRVMANKRCPSNANRTWLRKCGIGATLLSVTMRSHIDASGVVA